MTKRSWLLVFAVLLVPIIPWAIFGPAMESGIEGLLAHVGTTASARLGIGAAGVALLAADSFLPVPSTIVMSSLGLSFGILVGGILASLGLALSGLIAYLACRRFGRRVALRIAGEKGMQRLESATRRLGPAVIAITRAVPVAQEATACLAGLSEMPMSSFLPALLLGSVATGFAYAAIGASAMQSQSTALLLSAVVPALSWAVVFVILRSSKKPDGKVLSQEPIGSPERKT
jgi:uncharacterized membrane protein YdjX (TVP38/TMEM64 family)